MYRMFYKGQFIGNTRYFSDVGWIACDLRGQHCYRLKNRGAAKRWLTEMYLKHNVSTQERGQ